MRWHAAPSVLLASLALAQGPKPYIEFLIGNSAGMASDTCGLADVDATAECAGADVACVDCTSTGCDNALSDDSRLWQAKRAARNLVDGFGEATFALARFHQSQTPFSCKGGGWTGAGAGCAGDPVDTGDNRADLLVPFSDDSSTDIATWLDGCDNWPTTGDCDAALNLAPDTTCGLCADCGTGCDREVRPSGDAPLAGALASARSFLSAEQIADPRAACRTYAVVLFTDGVNDCPGDAVAEAAALCASGFPTLVVGVDDAALLSDLQAIASAGCDAACVGSPARCDGQVHFADDDAGLSLAMQQLIGNPIFELCNGLDDDCNGLVDDGFTTLGDFCCNPCPGQFVCNLTQDGTLCEGPGPCFEVCNGIDDDCDGLVDEGCCSTAYDVCNGIDDDCEGETDEDFGEPPPTCGIDEGECSFGIMCCYEGELVCCGADGPNPESCNCLDDDCNGLTDEVGRRRCYGGAADECPDPESDTCVGICRPGLQYCTTAFCPGTPAYGACIGWIGPRAEACNCLDDDCDGSTDDDATCPNGAPCVQCACADSCDDASSCATGYVCNCTGASSACYCRLDPCTGVQCGAGMVCDSATGACAPAPEGPDGSDPADAGARPITIAAGGCACTLSPAANAGSAWLALALVLVLALRLRR